MLVDRRGMIAGGAALALSGPAWAQRRRQSDWFDRAIIIDALGGIRDPYEKDEITRFSQRGFDETMATGVTMLRDTVFPVGNIVDPWGEYQKAVKSYQAFFAANPDRLIQVRSAADILKAKREKKFAVLMGTQDSVMVESSVLRTWSVTARAPVWLMTSGRLASAAASAIVLCPPWLRSSNSFSASIRSIVARPSFVSPASRGSSAPSPDRLPLL